MTRKPSLKSNVQAVPESVSVGRKRDRLLSAKILDATLDVLADVGASGLTMDLVATRAGSGKGAIYRRWESKSDLVIDAIAQLKRGHINLPNLPDTGTLRGDLLALFKPLSKRERDRWGKIMSALASLVGQDQSYCLHWMQKALFEQDFSKDGKKISRPGSNPDSLGEAMQGQ